MLHHGEYIIRIGKAHRRGGSLDFGIKLHDRLLHQYIVGQTGTGKSTLLANMAWQDTQHGHGFILVEPHGDLALHLSRYLGREHIYWDVADPHSPYGYNPLTNVSAQFRPLVASGLIETLKQQWRDSWGPRMEHLLRYAILALLEQPRADMRDIVRLYIDKDFRREVTSRLSDPQVSQFWRVEYPGMNHKTAVDGVAPVLNKLGAFLAYPVVRQTICEPEQSLRFRKLMDDGRCVIVNLAKGKLGTDTANVLGGLIVSSVLNAAFSRHDTPEDSRKPFFLYADEFHAFSTMSLANVLSEARKYGLGLVLSHQYTSQVDHHILEAIMGNVGTIMAFRVGVLDTPLLTRQFPDIASHSLVQQPNHHAYTQLMVDGMKSKVFSANTHPPMMGATG